MNEQSRAFWKKLFADCVSHTYQYSALGARTQEFTPSVKPLGSRFRRNGLPQRSGEQ
jgi:hypothetical protein